MLVLMIEDNQDDYILFSRYVAKIGDVVIEWRDSLKQALAYLKSNSVDAVLLDMSLPDGHGLAIFDQTQAQFPELPIIILSGSDDEELALEAVRRGAQDYLVKDQVDGEMLRRSLRYAVERNRVEEKLRRSEDLYRTFVHNFPNGILAFYDHDLYCTLVDGLGMAELGLSKEGIEGKSLLEAFPPEIVAPHEPFLRAALAGETVSEEIVYEGQTLLVNFVPVHDSSGVIISGMIMSQNISKRKQVEQALRNSEEQFRSAFTYAAIGIALVGLDGRWLQVNRALCAIVGYSEQELLTKTFQDITHPDDLASDLNFVAQLLTGEIETYQMAKRYFHRLGHEIWVLLSVSLVRDGDGQPLHFISQIQDITQRKQAEERLSQERDLLRALIDSTPDYIFIKDAQGRFVVSNIAHAQAANAVPDELIDKTAFDVFPPDLAAQFHADDEQIMQSGQPLINLERSTIGVQGESKTVLTTKIPLRGKDGHISGLVGISRDITERKQLEAQTIELTAERERIRILQRFISDMSHDLRTPLSIINSSLYLMQKSTDALKQQAHVQRMEQQLLRMDKLLTEVLQMAQLDRQDLNLQLDLTEINAFLKRLIQEYEPMAAAKDIAIEFVPDSVSCFARIDVVEFAHAILNLIQNAVAYTPEDGTITIRTGMQDDQTIISVQDTGIGIEAGDLPHIFERFYRADQARSSVTGGHGLGLSIAQRIIEAHGGSIKVESAPGQGSAFSVQLPEG